MSKQTIMLVCSAGMSTSLLVTKMENAAKEKGLDTEIFAISASDIDNNLSNKKIDAILLGPQVRFMKNQISEKAQSYNIPVEVIDMSDYGLMNGSNVLKTALSIIADK